MVFWQALSLGTVPWPYPFTYFTVKCFAAWGTTIPWFCWLFQFRVYFVGWMWFPPDFQHLLQQPSMWKEVTRRCIMGNIVQSNTWNPSFWSIQLYVFILYLLRQMSLLLYSCYHGNDAIESHVFAVWTGCLYAQCINPDFCRHMPNDLHLCF